MSKQRWSVVGTGPISRSVVGDLGSVDGVDVVAVHSRTSVGAAAFAREFGIPRWTDSLDELLAAADIDVVYIATPFTTHYEICSRALLAGKHVLVEKPMGTNVAEVRQLFEIAKERGVLLMEAMWFKFNPTIRRLHAEIERGRIGEVRNLRAGFSVPFPADNSSRWRKDGSPGSLLDQGIYPVTLACALFGSPVSVHASGTSREDGIDLTEHFTLDFADGKFAQGASGMTEFTDLTAAIGGTQGWIAITAPFWASPTLEVHADDPDTIFHHPEVIVTEWAGNGYVPMLTAFAEAVTSGQGEHPIHPASATIEVFTILDEIRTQVASTE